MNGKLLKPGEKGKIVLGNHFTLVLKLVTEVPTEGSAAGTVPHLAMASVGGNAKSNIVGMVMMKEGVGLKQTCFLESGG